jgi:nitrogen regulatory protein P-II 1
VDLVVKDWDVPRVMDLVGEGARTGNMGGNVGDGKIFVIDASDAMRIRTGEKGVHAI